MSTAHSWERNYKHALDVFIEELCRSFFMTSPSESVIWEKGKSKLLKHLIEGNHTDRGTVGHWVHLHLLEIGAATFEEHRNSGQSPDNCLQSHYALGYAIKHKRVPAELIQFDHGENAEYYIKKADGLLESVVEQLLTYKDAVTPVSEPRRWPHYCAVNKF